MATSRTPARFFEPLAIGAPRPYRSLPVRLERMIHFVPPHNAKIVSRIKEIAADVDVVLGMATAVGDDAARTFAAGLYGSLAGGESVHAAFRQGCAALHLDPGDRQITRDIQQGAAERDVPHIDVRRGVDADRVRFS